MRTLCTNEGRIYNFFVIQEKGVNISDLYSDWLGIGSEADAPTTLQQSLDNQHIKQINTDSLGSYHGPFFKFISDALWSKLLIE